VKPGVLIGEQMAIGRISGQLLKSNLLRDGVDLAFETDLLYLDVTNSRIGVRTSTPTTDLDVNGTIRSTNLTVDTQLTVGNLQFNGNTITSDDSTIVFAAAAGEATVYHSRLKIDDLQLQGNVISTTVSNSSIDLVPNGTGEINLLANTNINGNLVVSGNINATGNVVIGGNIQIGDAQTDEIVVNASISSDLIPETDAVYDLGTALVRWNSVYTQSLYTNATFLPTLQVGNLVFQDNQITTTTGDITIEGNAAGGIRLGNFKIVDNTITNIVSNQITTINQTGLGYVKFVGTNGFVPPRGTEAQRPNAYAVTGMTRYNTNSKALEIWDGISWASPAGASGAVSETQANDISLSYVLTLG
jgi:cytoskeletal protein CcmA (bactofilin family)